MANISSAIGNVTISADSYDTIINYLYLHHISGYNKIFDFYIEIGPNNLETLKDIEDCLKFEISQYHTKDSNNKIETSLEFQGSGRYYMEATLTWILNALKNPIELSMFNYFKEHSISFEFNYVDSEPGCGFITENTTRINWDPKQNVSEIETITHKSYDYNEDLLDEIEREYL